MNQKLAEALDTCIKSMEAGASLEECLKKYPDMAAEMQGLLATVENIECLRVGDITEEQFAQSRQMLLARANELVLEDKHWFEQSVTKRILYQFIGIVQSIRRAWPHVGRLATALALAIVLIALSGGLIISSAKSLPGDSLYPVKLAVENIKVHLAPSYGVREEYEINYQQQRVVEIQRLMAMGRQRKISFEGILASIDGNTWLVSGVPVKVGVETNIQAGMVGIDSIQVGMKIEVEGVTGVDGSVVADEIHVREYQYRGIVDEIGQQSWRISGASLYVSDHTQIDAGIKPGDEVAVLVQSEDDSTYALAISHYTQPTPGPLYPNTTPAYPSLDEEQPDIDIEELELDGVVDEINPEYWTVNGVSIYIAGDTQLEDGIHTGDEVSVRYIVGANGSYTAIEIDKSDLNTHEEIGGEATANPGADSDGASIATKSSTEHEEPEASTPSPESAGTPEPSEDH